jgi:hypothetical protein
MVRLNGKVTPSAEVIARPWLADGKATLTAAGAAMHEMPKARPVR